ncbi:unnamed protein product [Urochloa humidicola]
MAGGRFLTRKLTSTMSRSRSLLGPHAPAPGCAGAAATRTAAAARYFNTFPCSSIATKTNCSTTSMPSIIINHLKPACVSSSGGAKRSFSSTASTRHEISRSAKMAAWATEWDAKSAAFQAQCTAWDAEIRTKTADFDKFITSQVCLWGFALSCWIGVASLVEENGTRCCNGQSGSRHCSSCCNSQCVFSKS